MESKTAEREYRLHERAVHAMLARRHPPITADERAELYQEAWASVLSQRARGNSIEALEAYLVGAADKLAAKRLHCADARRRITFDPLDGPFASVADESDSPEERALAEEEERRLRLLVEELGAREQAVLKLRLDAGLEAREIRDRLGLSERQYRRIAERAVRALLTQMASEEGGLWARRQRSLLCACAFGIASQRQRERARRLMESDPFCRAMMRELRTAGRRAGALVPVPAGDPRPAGRLAELLPAARDHAAGLSSRVLDATPLAGARPGAAAAVVTGCLAAGGGAICAVDGVPEGMRPVLGEERAAREERPVQERRRKPSAAVAAPAVQTPPREARPSEQAPAPRPIPAPVPAREFEPGGTRAAPATPVPTAPGASPEFAP